MIKNLLIAIGICAVVAFCIYLLHPISFVSPVKAEEYHHCWDIDGCPRHHRRGYRELRPQVRYYADPERERRDRDLGAPNRNFCLGPVRGVGTQWIGTEGALEAAKKDWSERVRFDHGESFLDLTHAIDLESRCGRTSIGEVAGQVLYRCELIATPCKAEFEPMDTPQK